MAPFVTVSAETKDRLERLQATIRSETGTEVSQQEILDRLVTEASENPASLTASFRDE